MLEQTRRQASIFVYIIFGLLIVIFIYGINPGNRGGADGGGCSTSSNTVVRVDGSDAGPSAFLVAYSSNQGQGRQRTYLALDEVIYRELLAQAAADRGIRTSGDLIDDEIMKEKHGYFYLGGERIDVTGQFFEDGVYKHKRWLDWVASRNLQSPGAYREEQARGMQAALMADIIKDSVRVSRDEALSNYLYENNTVTYDVVPFDPGNYRRTMRLADADIKRYLDDHGTEVEARYKADERTYKAVKPQVSLREIFIPKAAPQPKAAPEAKPEDKAAPADDKAAKPDDKAAKADDKAKPGAAKPDDKADKAKPGDKAKTAKADDKAKPGAAKPDDKADKAKPGDKAGKADDKTAKADDKKPAAGEPAKPIGLPIEAAKAKLEAVRAEIAAGKLSFPDAEKRLAADAIDDAPAENGDRGWVSLEKPGLGDKEVNDALKSLKPNEMSPVIATERGAYLVMVTGKREGDLSFDQVKTEIATNLAKDAWSKEAAKRAALDALASAQGGTGKNLDQMFEREPVRPSGGGIEQILQDPNLTQEQKQKIFEQFMKAQQKHGSLETHEVDVPVAWFEDADGSGNSGAAAGSSAPAAPAPAAPASAGAGGAAPAPAAGSAAPAAGATPAAPAAPAAPVEIVASKDQLPQFSDVPKPMVARFGPAPREAKMPGVGGSKPAIDALFEELAPGNLGKKVYEGDNNTYVLVQLIGHAQPKIEEFEKTADAEIRRMQEARGKAALRDFLRSRCDALTKAGKIRPAADRIRETDDKGNPAPTVYHPCMFLDYLDR